MVCENSNQVCVLMGGHKIVHIIFEKDRGMQA